jgi:hypothetical protein
MSGIKFAIIVMTTLIVIGLGLLGYGLATKTGTPRNTETAAQIELPAGTVILGATGLGPNVLSLHLRSSPPGKEWFLLVDPMTGRKLGQLDVVTAAKAAVPEYP